MICVFYYFTDDLIEILNQFPNENGADFEQIRIEESLLGECSLFFFPHLLLFSWCNFDGLSTVLCRPSIFFNEVDNYILLCLFFFCLLEIVGKEMETRLGLGIYPRFTQFRLQCIITLLYFFFFLYFGCLAIVAVLVIVGRDMGRGAGEDA